MSNPKSFLFALTVFCLLISGCGPNGTALPATLVAVPSASQTSQPIPTLTATQPATDLPSTPTITPLPTIPTFTPTFDVRTIIRATPGIAVCPKKNPTIRIDLGLAKTRACFTSLTANDDYNQCVDRKIQPKMLEFLNQGGDMNAIISQLKVDDRSFIYQDLTHDEIKDFAFRNANDLFSGYYFYTCTEAVYKVQTIFDGDPKAFVIGVNSIKDLNANGIPEIIIVAEGVLITFEWDGDSFEETMRIYEYGDARFNMQDIDKNGTQEIIVSRGFPPNWNWEQEFPWRHYVSIYSWNGTSFVAFSKEFNLPIYQFQAIQDADRYILNNNYSKAISLYQEAIFNHKLEWFSSVRRDYLLQSGVAWGDTPDLLLPTPIPNSTEYPKLAAYAYYRMVILHTQLGEMDAASTQYATLQQKFPAGSPGHAYAEMASAFWKAYQSSQKMVDGCGAAIQYAAEHAEILVPLGSDYHGAQSHIYVPADVCPFR